MSAVAANVAVISCSATSGGTYDTITGIDSASYDDGLDVLDTTAFSDGVDRTFIFGLRTNTLSISGRFERSDTGYAKIPTAYQASPPVSVFVKVLFDGTNGWRREYLVTKHTVKGQVDGKVEVDIELQATGAMVAVP